MAEVDYIFLPDVMNEVSVPERGILSRTVQDDASSKIVLFAFAPGEELSEHTSSMPAVLYFLRGEAELTLGVERVEARSNSLAHMLPNLRHAIRAKTALIMLLVLAKTNRPKVAAA